MTMESNARLLTEQELAELGPPEAVRLPVDLVDPNPQNPRRDLAEVDALADNIKAFGLLQPVTVRRAGERYELLGGHRRRAAFLLLREREPHDPQWRTLPAVVRTADDERSYLMLLSGQLHSRNWRPREESIALERLAETRTLKEVGALVHKGEPWVSKRLRVYADAVLAGFVIAGGLPITVAEELLLARDPAVRKSLAEQAIAEGWGQLQARNEIRKLKLSKQVREVAKRARELLDILSQVDITKLPPRTTNDLWTLRGRIDQIGRGGPVMPSIEQAQRAAGVRDQERPPKRGQRRRPGYKPRA